MDKSDLASGTGKDTSGGVLSVETNTAWDEAQPRISVITSVFNRGELLPRALKSVAAQKCKNFEYILVNDGSTENIDGIARKFMNENQFPVMYIKKKNGGVHTGRNAGVRESRGELILFIDSDNELLPTATEICIQRWEEIPLPERGEYAGVRLKCVDERGKMKGKAFPDNINELEYREALKIYREIGIHVEHMAVRSGEILRNNPWPEPYHVSYVTEEILWMKLEKEYKWKFYNDMILVYHEDAEFSITRPQNRKYDVQKLINIRWNLVYRLNHPDIYIDNKMIWIEMLAKYTVYDRILKKAHNEIWRLSEKPEDTVARFFAFLFRIPSIPVAVWFQKKYMVLP